MINVRLCLSLATVFFVTGCTDLVSKVGNFATGDVRYAQLAVDGDGNVVAYTKGFLGGSAIYVKDYDLIGNPVAICTSSEYAGCGNPSLSASGNFVVFDSLRDDLVLGDTNDARDVFLLRRDTGVITRLSQLANGANFNGESKLPTISGNGKLVAFETNASNIPGYPFSTTNTVVLLNTTTGNFKIAPLGAFNSRKSAFQPDLSADGSKLTYDSRASGIVTSPINTNAISQIYQYDIATGINTMVSVLPGGTAGDEDSVGSRNSGDGSKVLFFSDTEFEPGAICPPGHLWVRTMASLSQERVTVETDGSCTFGGGPFTATNRIASDIDDAGEKVVFSPRSLSIVDSPDPSPQPSQVYLRNLASDSTIMLSFNSVEVAPEVFEIEISNDISQFARISGDGKRSAYLSEATNLTDQLYFDNSYNVFLYNPPSD